MCMKNYKKNDLLELGFDGLIIKIIRKQENFIEAKCVREGLLEANKGVHLINRKIKLNFLTSKDFAAINIAKKYKIKNYALSFTNSIDDILRFNKLLPKSKKFLKLKQLKH